MKFAAAFTLLIFHSNLDAQSPIDCSYFCVAGITVDTIGPNTLQISVDMDGTGSDFVNYPHITELVEDATGDTVATGSIYYFGQMDGTSLDYPMSTVLDSLPVGFSGTAWFKYNDTVICELPFPCTAASYHSLNDEPGVRLFPNPSCGLFTISLTSIKSGTAYVVRNLLGAIIQHEQIISKSTKINLSHMPEGLYILEILNGDNYEFIKFIIHD